MKNLQLFLLLLLLPDAINCDGRFFQRLSCNYRVKVLLGMIWPGKNVETYMPVNITLERGVERSFGMAVEGHFDFTEFTITVFHASYGTQLGPKLHRRMPTIRTDDHYVDVYKMGHTLLTVRSRYECVTSYYGPHCLKYCNNTVENLSHHRCDNVTGDQRCDIGYMGPNCAHRLDPRNCDCENSGHCVTALHNDSIFQCECHPGTSGERCENHNATEASIVDNSHVCSLENPCFNGGKCFANGLIPYCDCRPGFAGDFCQAFIEPGKFREEPVIKHSHLLLVFFIILALIASSVYIVTRYIAPQPPLEMMHITYQDLLARHEEPTPKHREANMESPPPYSACVIEESCSSACVIEENVPSACVVEENCSTACVVEEEEPAPVTIA